MSRPSGRAYAGLCIVSVINLLNFADRFVVGGVQELIKRDKTFGGGARDAAGLLTDASLGALTTMFVVVFMLASPFTGWLGDRVPRRFLICGGVLVWSLATLGSGFAPSFAWLLVARAFIGAGEAGYATVAPSLLADLFPTSWRGKALGVFNVVMPLGAAVGFGLGGFVGAHWGWRHAFWVAGIPGLFLAFASLLLPEPERGAQDGPGPKAAALSPAATVRALVTNRDYVFNTAGQVLLTFTVGGLANWMPSFFVRQLGLEQGVAGTYFGILTASAGLLGTIAGTVAGEIAQRKNPRGYFWVSGVSLVLSAPCILVVAKAPGMVGTLAATFLTLFLVLINAAPLYTALINSVPAHLRASAVAFNLLATHVLGDAISPPIIGAISDVTGSLPMAVAACAPPVLVSAGILLWASRPAPEIKTQVAA